MFFINGKEGKLALGEDPCTRMKGGPWGPPGNQNGRGQAGDGTVARVREVTLVVFRGTMEEKRAGLQEMV